MKNNLTQCHALAIASALLVAACSETPVRATPIVNPPAVSAPKPASNAATMVSYACNAHKTIAVTYRSDGSDQTAKIVLEGKVLILTQVGDQSGAPAYVSEPYTLRLTNSGEIRQAGMTVLKRQTRKVNGVVQSYDAPLLEDCRPR
jgi:membrane-bound inhibitor of C-type lysozyme